MNTLVPVERIEKKIVILRGHKVMLDTDLAALYGVPTKRLNEQVKRNLERFPPDFAFRLTAQEKSKVVANCDHLRNLKFSPVLPHAFTEHGALALSFVLNSAVAARVSVEVVRAFVRLREFAAAQGDLSRRLDGLEIEIRRGVSRHDTQIAAVFEVLRKLTTPSSNESRQRIGFQT